MKPADHHERESFPRKYLQESSAHRTETGRASSSENLFDVPGQEAHWEYQLSELSRVDRILKKRRLELQEVDAVLTDRRHELDEVFHKRKVAEARLRRAEEDAGVIEHRAAETSVELIRASNQLINLELKGNELTERKAQMSKSIEAKTKELEEVEKSCNDAKQNIDQLNQEMRSKKELAENKEHELKDVESRLQLSLRVEELRKTVATIEREERNQTEKYVNALREGEKALEEKTAQLARTRNDSQSQMIKFHELNNEITRSRSELREIQINIKSEINQGNQLSVKREEEKKIHELKMQETEAKLEQINEARSESMVALKSQREEFTLLRRKVNESVTRIKGYDNSKKQKESELKELSSLIGESKIELEKLKAAANEKHMELQRANADYKMERDNLEALSDKLKLVQEKHKNCLEQKEEAEKEVMLLENEVTRLKSERQAEKESTDQIAGTLKEVKGELAATREELLTTCTAKDLATKQLHGLEVSLIERSDELKRVNGEIEEATKDLQMTTNNVTEAQAKHDDILKEIEKLWNELEKTAKNTSDEESPSKINTSMAEATVAEDTKKDNEPLVTRLQVCVNRLMAENDEKTEALINANVEIGELKEFMTNEREKAQEYLLQMASEVEVNHQQFERLQMVYDAEKLRNSNEKELLLKKTEQHQWKARKLSEELTSLKQNHFQTKQELNQMKETLGKDVKVLNGHIQQMASQMRSELALSLREVESSREHALDELRGDQDEMQVQLLALQHSVHSAQEIAQVVEKEKSFPGSKGEKEEAVLKHEGVKLQRHQTYLRAQIKQQMSTRAEILDEERKKAEGSLAGLKCKLRNLEQVISRKDVSVQDFRIKLLTSKVEMERSVESNKQIDELRKRLRDVEDEKDLITRQRNHLVKLKTDANLDGISIDSHRRFVEQNRTTAPTSRQLRRSLDSLIGDSIHKRQTTFLKEFPGSLRLEGEVPCRDEVQLQTSELHGNASPYSHTSLKDPAILTTSDLRHQNANELDVSLERTSQRSMNYLNEMSKVDLLRNHLNSEGHEGKELSRPPTTPTTFGYKFHSRLIQNNGENHRKGRQERQKNTTPQLQVLGSRSSSASSFADDKKSEFLSSVHRLKNEKVKQLESSFRKLILM